MKRSDVVRWLRRTHIVGKAVMVSGILASVGIMIAVNHEQKELQIEISDVANMHVIEGSELYESLAQVSTEAVVVDVVAATEKSEFDGRFIANITDTLNIRSEANAESEVVGKLYPGCVGDIVAVCGEWTQITSGEVSGFVKSEFIVTGQEAEVLAEEYGKYVGTVHADVLYVRRDADSQSDAIAMLVQDDEVIVTDTLDGWYQVLVNESWEGYVSADYLEVEYKLETAITIEEEMARIQAQKEAEMAAQEAERQAAAQNTSSNASASNGGNATTVETTVQAPTAASYDDAYLLACLVSMEAGYEPYEGQLAVANVVLNRLHSGYYGSTISSVIYAKGQFPSVNGKVMTGYLQNGPLPQAQQAANEALSGVNNIGGYTGFINVKYANYGAYSDYTIIGNHCFH